MERAKTQHGKKKKLNVAIKSNKIKMLNFDYITKQDLKGKNSNQLQC